MLYVSFKADCIPLNQPEPAAAGPPLTPRFLLLAAEELAESAERAGPGLDGPLGLDLRTKACQLSSSKSSCGLFDSGLGSMSPPSSQVEDGDRLRPSESMFESGCWKGLDGGGGGRPKELAGGGAKGMEDCGVKTEGGLAKLELECGGG